MKLILRGEQVMEYYCCLQLPDWLFIQGLLEFLVTNKLFLRRKLTPCLRKAVTTFGKVTKHNLTPEGGAEGTWGHAVSSAGKHRLKLSPR